MKLDLNNMNREEFTSDNQSSWNSMNERMLKQLTNQKDAIIKEKLTEKGFAHLLVDIEKRRFKRIEREVHPHCEKWYADDGSIEGVLIVTFLNPEVQFSNKLNEPFTATTDIKYL